MQAFYILRVMGDGEDRLRGKGGGLALGGGGLRGVCPQLFVPNLYSGPQDSASLYQVRNARSCTLANVSLFVCIYLATILKLILDVTETIFLYSRKIFGSRQGISCEHPRHFRALQKARRL